MEYLNFELAVDAHGDGYDVRCRSPAGEAHAKLALPAGPGDLARLRDELEQGIERSRTRRIRRSDEASEPKRLASAQTIGTVLFNCLFTGRVLERYRASQAIAHHQEKGLRVQLRIEPPRIATVPWEFMFDSGDGEGTFVALNPNSPIVRYPEIDLALKPFEITPPLRILGMMAAPSDLPSLKKAEEVRRIESGLMELREKGAVELRWVPGGTYRDLQAELHHGPWHVFHFIGHGGFDERITDGGGYLAMEAERRADGRAGDTRKVSAAAISRVFRGHPSLRLVLLNSCLGAQGSEADAFSSAAATLVRRGVPAVVAMQYDISDDAAVAFAHAFYASLAAATPVDRAVTDARVHLNDNREDSLEWGTPVLLSRSPDGRLIVPPPGVEGVVVPPSPPPSVPFPLGLSLGGVALPLLLAGILAVWRVPQANMRLDALTTGVGVTLPVEWTLPDAIQVSRLDVSGLDQVSLSHSAEGSRTLKGDAVRLVGLDEPGRKATIKLDLGTIVPAGTAISLEVAESPGGYVLMTDSLGGLTVPVTGLLQVIMPAKFNERIDFNRSGSVGLLSRGRLLRMDFRPVPGSRAAFVRHLPIAELDLTRVDEYKSQGKTKPKTVSTLSAATLSVEGRPDTILGEGDQLRASSIRGEITELELTDSLLRLKLTAQAKGLSISTGPDTAGRSLMPTVLGWALTRHRPLLVGALALYLILLGLMLRLGMRRAR
jgi:hypothetical protein